jgi:hypothetical protein
MSLSTRLWMRRLASMLRVQPGADAWRSWMRVAQSLLPIPLVAHLVLHGALCASEEQPLSRSPVAHALINLDVASGLKLLLAQQMCDAESTDGLAAPDAQHSVILGDRNAAACAALDEALASGARNVAIFYGAAHCPDLEHRLVTGRHQLRRVAHSWLPAWRITMPGLPQPRQQSWGRVPELSKAQAAALFGLSAMLASDLYLWEVILRWAGINLHLLH